ncbi:hypothetical protein [Paraclostridium bifermentans]|uniref:hypothetical protein n=1 Tax=Paraclostridium bifermentans TaxID=1490 RepID=UPI00189D7659|nr:hypothetical protein [Paraclostridium bifermentans]
MNRELMNEIVKLGVDQIKKVPVTNFSQADREVALRDKLHELTETPYGKFDIMAYNKNKYEIFEVIREIISQTIENGEAEMSAFYNQFVEEDSIELGNTKEYYIENDSYLTVAKVSGNNWDLDRQRLDEGSTFTIKTSAYAIKVFEYFKRFMTGRSSFEDLVARVDISIKKFKDELVAQAFQEAVSNLPSNFSYTGSYNEASIEKVLTHTSAANKGANITLVGTRAALNKLQSITVANLSDAQKAEYGQKGFLREWHGYVCAELPTLFKKNSISEFVFDNETVYALPTSQAKPVKLVTEGSPLVAETTEISDNVDMTREFAVIFRIGAVAIFDRLIGHIKITA